MELSIIILNYNSTDYTKDCLKSIFKFTKGIKFEVIVIDNNSKDKLSVKKLKKDFPKIKLILNRKNLGFGKGNNQGISLAKGKYVLTLNNDTEIENNLFKDMVQFLKSKKDVAAVAVKSYTSKKKEKINSEAYKKEMTPFNLFLNEVFYAPLRFVFPKSKLIKHFLSMACDDENKSQYVAHLNGACMFYKKEALKDVGLFNKDYFLFCSETEWCKRAINQGWKIYYLASKYIIHKGGMSLRLVSGRGSLFHRDYCLFLKNNYSKFSVISYKLLSLIMVPISDLFHFLGRIKRKD